MNYDAVSFPYLGIGQIELDPIAFSIGDAVSVRWYAIIICIGMVVAFFFCNRLRQRFDIKEDDFIDCVLYTIPIAFIGARLTYVLGDLDNFNSFMDVIAIWNGGLAIYGGIIFAAISVFVICKIKKCDWRSMVDILAFGLIIGQIIGRWGNFVNIEVYGVETTLPWAMGVGYMGEGADMTVHPLFLYESLWNLIGFILIYGYMDLRKFKGEIFLWYSAWYGFGRGIMEPLRDTQYNLHLFGVRIMMVLALAFCVAAVIVIVILRKRSPGYVSVKSAKELKAESDYETQFNIDMSDLELTEEELAAKRVYDAIDEKTEDENDAQDNRR